MARPPMVLRLFNSCRMFSSLSVSPTISNSPKDFDKTTVLEIFPSVPDSHSHFSSRYAHELTIRRLLKTLRYGDIESLLEAHKADIRIQNESFLSSLIRSYGLAGMFDHALRTYEQMESFGTRRSVLSFNALLAACCDSKKFEKVRELFCEYSKKFCLKPDRKSYEILIQSCCALRDGEKAVTAMGEMNDKTSGASTKAFCTLLKFFYKERRVAEAGALWREMAEKGVELNAKAYSIRLKHEDEGGLDRVTEIIREMKMSGIEPNIFSYNKLIICYLRLKKLKEALLIYKGLKASNCRPNNATFSILITYLCEFHAYKYAFKIFMDSAYSNKLPRFRSLNVLTRGLVEKKLFNEANRCHKILTEKLEKDARNKWAVICKSLPLPFSNFK